MPMPKAMSMYTDFFTTLTQDTPLTSYETIFESNATFEDPFQKVQGVENIYKVFQHMYEGLHDPKFDIVEIINQDNVLYLQWNFNFSRTERSKPQSFIGVSRVEFNEKAKAISHIDYWDAASNIYEKLPLLGSILRFIKGKIRANI